MWRSDLSLSSFSPCYFLWHNSARGPKQTSRLSTLTLTILQQNHVFFFIQHRWRSKCSELEVYFQARGLVLAKKNTAIIEIPMNLQHKLIPLRKRKAEEESSDDSSDAKSPKTADPNLRSKWTSTFPLRKEKKNKKPFPKKNHFSKNHFWNLSR